MGEVNISKRAAKRIRTGHIWVYKSDVRELREVDAGAIVTVVDISAAQLELDREVAVSIFRLVRNLQTRPDKSGRR